MPLREPRWWYADRRNNPVWTRALRPAAALYGSVTARRMNGPKVRAPIPVICVGNLTAGGSGKTPLVRAIVALLKDRGVRPVILSRGHGGRLAGPVAVSDTHSAHDVGDEPKLLAGDEVPVVVARRRDVGAAFIARLFPKSDVIVMDDGLQNRHLAFDLGIAAINPGRGIGNGEVIPLGPLRAPIDVQKPSIGALVITGRKAESVDWSFLGDLEPGPSRPLLQAEIKPGNAGSFRGKRVHAFAGIANPERFFGLLNEIGADVARTTTFADHASLSDTDVDALLEAARRNGAMLATTEKDMARLDPSRNSHQRLAGLATALSITLAFEQDQHETLIDLLNKVLQRT